MSDAEEFISWVKELYEHREDDPDHFHYAASYFAALVEMRVKAEHEAEVAKLLAELERLRAENEALLDALVWCSGSSDFHEGGIAREGWLKLCQPLLDVARELDAREESDDPSR